jgi:hypothetical protein
MIGGRVEGSILAALMLAAVRESEDMAFLGDPKCPSRR